MLLFCLKLKLERDYQLLIPCKNLVASGDKINKNSSNIRGLNFIFLAISMIIAADIVKKLVYKVYRPDPKMI
jgi:hypothetical protein